MEDLHRIFVGGIPVRTGKEAVREFFGRFGAIRHCKVKKNSKTGRSLGYAYITFENSEACKSLLNTQVEFSGRICECKPVYKKEQLKEELAREKRRKLLVYGLDPAITNCELSTLFESLMNISHAYVVKDSDSFLNQGYGYVVFNTEIELESFCSQNPLLTIKGKEIMYSRELRAPSKKSPKNTKHPALTKIESQKHQDISLSLYNARHLGLARRDSSKSYLESAGDKSHVQSREHFDQTLMQVSGIHSLCPAPKMLHQQHENDKSTLIDPKRSPVKNKIATDWTERNCPVPPAEQVASDSYGVSALKAEGFNTGLTKSTKNGVDADQLSPKSHNPILLRSHQTSAMRCILRASLYLNQCRKNIRFNRTSARLL